MVRLRAVLENKFVIYYTQKKRLKCMLWLGNNRKTTLTVTYTLSIAFAYFIANNTDPSIVSLDETKLRKHLYFGFQDSKMVPFLLSSRKEQKNKEKKLYSWIYIATLMSCSNFAAGNFDMHMVKCDVCLEWFHRMCECIPDIAFCPNVNW